MAKDNEFKYRKTYFPERVTEAMNKILAYNISIVEAPMGFGKTTSVREHLKYSKANVLWLKIFDSSIRHFWNSFCQLFTEFDAHHSQSLLELGFPVDMAAIQEITRLIEGIQFPEKTVLVIDDYHLLNENDINSFIEFLVVNEIENLHIVLVTRFINQFKIEELSLKGYLYIITKETFEFEQRDIVNYFKLCGITLKNDEADKLYSRTEGWISGLYLLMLNYKKEGCFTMLDGINSLIEKAVYELFSDEIKDLLLTMCIFSDFSVEQAEFIWDNKNSEVEKLLTEVKNKNAFVKYDSKTKKYQFHSIFSSFLSEKLENKNIKLNLYQKAAQWCVKTGEYKDAMHYFYLCKDFDNLLYAIEEEKVKYKEKYFENDKDLLIKYMEECPTDIRRKHHIALLVYGIRMMSYNERELFAKVCSELPRNILTDEELDDTLRNHFLGEFEFLISFTKHNNITEMTKHMIKGYKLLSEPSILFDRKAISTTFGSPSVLYMFYRETGKLEEHVNELLRSFPYFHKATDGNASGQEFIMEGEWYLCKGDAENAEISMHKAMIEAETYSQTQIVICALFLHIRIALIKGRDITYIQGLFQNMYEKLGNKRTYFLVPTIEMCEGYIYSLLNEKERIPEWVCSGDLSKVRIMFPTLAMFNIVYGRTLLIKGEYLKLIGSAEGFIKFASIFPNILGQIYTYIYIAAANNRVFREHQALADLKRALDMALPDEMYLPFVENCDYIKPLLEVLRDKGIYREEIKIILELYSSYSTAVTKIINMITKVEKPQLTDREREIALLAANGLTNKEIGEKLFVSPNTIKSQLKNIFSKLNVTSRALLIQHFNEKS